jgi:phosphoglycerol transferase MdoB-like AlkP superfamily enzyme
MLEGWSATTVDELRAGKGLPPLGITPNFSALAREGLLLTRMYASGQRTRPGLTALLAGLGSVPGVPTLGEGLEDLRLTFLGDMARAEGHATCYVMGFMAASQREAHIAGETGFDEVLAGEEVLGGEAGSALVAMDHQIFEAAGRRIRSLREPFLAFIHTASTHVPYARPKGGKDPFPGDTLEHRYWNTVAYADRSLGRFVERARADGWFDRTIFVLVSDHIQRAEAGDTDGPGLFHIPALLAGPGVPRGAHAGIAGQTDVLPTIAHLAGWGVPCAAFGRSILDAAAPHRGALGRTPTLSLRVEEGGWVSRSPRARTGSAGADPDGIEKRLLALTETERQLVLRNRLVPPR